MFMLIILATPMVLLQHLAIHIKMELTVIFVILVKIILALGDLCPMLSLMKRERFAL